MFDIAIRNGKVVDGTGNPWFRADVGIIGEKIVCVGKIEAGQAHREIDAEGHLMPRRRKDPGRPCVPGMGLPGKTIRLRSPLI